LISINTIGKRRSENAWRRIEKFIALLFFSLLDDAIVVLRKNEKTPRIVERINGILQPN
jgi:hypothetical protein